MELKGSCHGGSVKFTVQSPHPYPFNLCYCSICRKTAGGGGYAINLSGRYKTLKVTGRKNITVYRARLRDEATGKITKSTGRRNFCKKCGSALWLWDPAVAGAGASVRLGDRYRSSGSSGADAPDVGIESELGAGLLRPAR